MATDSSFDRARRDRRRRKRLKVLLLAVRRLDRLASEPDGDERAARLGRAWKAASEAYDAYERLQGIPSASVALGRPRGKVVLSADGWLNDPRPTCPRCSLPRMDVVSRPNPFYVEGIDVCPENITCCHACWQQLRDEI